MAKLWNGNFNLGDFVMIICEVPYGICEGSWYPKVKGSLGVITKVCDYTSCDGFPCFEVKDEKGNEFSYAENELIPAFEIEIRRVLKELLERG